MLIILISLIFIRPFIASLAFPCLNFIHSAILLAALAIWFIHKGMPLKKIAPLQPPLIVFLLALLICIVFSIDKINSLKELYKYISGILLFLFAASLTYENRMRIIKAIVLSGLIISLLAIYQYFFGFQHILEYLSRNGTASPFALDYIQRKRVFFPFVVPNILGGYLAMVAFLSLGLWDKKKKGVFSRRLFILILLSVSILLSKSLGVFLSIFLVSIIYFYFYGKLNKKTLAIMLGILIILGLIFILRQASAKEHTQPLFSLARRFYYWRSSIDIIKSSPWTGVGLGNFNLALSRYAHNSFLQIWAEMGILGIISFLWLIIIVFKYAFDNIKHAPDLKGLIIALIAANAVFLIHNLVDFSFFLPEASLAWWTILGCLWDIHNC